MKFFLSPISVVGFARSILQRIKSAQNPGPTAPRQKGGTVSYASDGRSGYVWYQNKETRFALYYEFGGSDCVATIDIPSPEQWEKHTGLPPETRAEILQIIGDQVVKDQVRSGRGYFKIEGNALNIYA